MSAKKQKNHKILLGYAKFTVAAAIVISFFVQPLTAKSAMLSDFWKVLSNLSKNTLSTQEATAADSLEGTPLNQVEEKPDHTVLTTPVVIADMKVDAVISAYSSTPDQTDDTPFIAASGKHVHDGMIAANWLPFGTKVKIPALFGDKIFVVEDRMNARYGYGRIDIWMDAPKADLYKFGVKRTEVEVYYPDKLKKNADQLVVVK